MNKRRSRVRLSSRRWAAYTTAGLASALSPGAASADHSCTVEFPNVQMMDSNPGDGLFDNVFSQTLYRSDVVLFFNHGYSETQPGNGILNFNGSAPSTAMLSIAGFQNGNYFYASNGYYGQQFSALNFIPAGERMDMAWASGYSSSQFVNTGGYVVFRYDVGNGTQYGWLELTLDSSAPANIFTVSTFVTSEAGTELFVGGIHLDCIPEPGSLGLLALGAAGLLLWRNRRVKANAG
ncbi:MAG: PEP-CTERM sorting domain-containing protein [Planctomycetota bacterium]